jgi:hypothetical protein
LKQKLGGSLGPWEWESPEMSKTTYVNCTVEEGLFSNEFYVTVKDASFYADRVNVQVNRTPHKGDEVEGKIVAYVVQVKNDQALVEFPVADGHRTWVSKADLVFA